ncbi:MAG: hypothetical protein JW791_05225 [Nanoarchaeota archaeon]|nr:hypothetical protein [Nanoarchaeota archaeon]
MFYVLLSSLTLWYFISTSKKIDKKKAGILFIIYVLFILQELGVSIFVF